MKPFEKNGMKVRWTLIVFAVMILSGCATLEAVTESLLHPSPEMQEQLDSMNLYFAIEKLRHR
jgi:hypothetical protein